MGRRTNRREFLHQTAATGMGFRVAGGVTPAQSKSPNEKLNIAGVGVGGEGAGDIASTSKGQNGNELTT